MDSIFVPPPGLDRGRPREVRLSMAGRLLVIVIGMFFVGGPVVGYSIARTTSSQASERQRLAHDGAQASGVVKRLWRPSKDSKQWSLTYEFSASGRTYSAQSKIPRAWSEILEVGGAVPIRYVVDDPSVSIPVGLTPRVLPLWLPYPVAASFMAVGLMALIALRRERELLADGRVAGAVVTKHLKRHTQHGGTYLQVRYEFQTIGGTTVSGGSTMTRKAPAIGSTICVIYDSERPKRNKPYPFSLVTLNNVVQVPGS